MTKDISTKVTSSNIAQVLGLLAETPVQLEALSRSVSVKKRNQPLGEGERSLIETLAHLVNSEARISESIYLALLMDEPLIANIHSERDWGQLLQYDLSDFDELLAYFKFRRTVMLRVLSGLKEAQWSRAIREDGKQRKEPVYWRARSLALHEAEHVGDLERKLKK
jgi:DinB superfamily